MVVTTGRFTNPAQEDANRLQQNDDPYQIELLDGEDLRETADEIGLDLYNGRIEILCDETLRPYEPAADVDAPVEEAFRDVENIEVADLPDPHSSVTFRPVVAVTANTNAVFETSVGVIHRINDRTQFVAHAERGQPQVVDEDVVVRTLRTVQFGRWPLPKRIPERCCLPRLEASRPDWVAVDEDRPAPLVPV